MLVRARADAQAGARVSSAMEEVLDAKNEAPTGRNAGRKIRPGPQAEVGSVSGRLRRSAMKQGGCLCVFRQE